MSDTPTPQGVVRDDERKIIIIEGPDGVDDELSAKVRNDRLRVQIDEPWAGDSETGFGRSCSLTLGPDEARALAEWLLWACEQVKSDAG